MLYVPQHTSYQMTPFLDQQYLKNRLAAEACNPLIGLGFAEVAVRWGWRMGSDKSYWLDYYK